jgi:hypothetical protein
LRCDTDMDGVKEPLVQIRTLLTHRPLPKRMGLVNP